MGIHNSIGVYIIQLGIFVTELYTSVSNDMDVQNSLQLWISIIELWVNAVRDAMISKHRKVNVTHNSIMNIHNSYIDIHDSTYGYS